MSFISATSSNEAPAKSRSSLARLKARSNSSNFKRAKPARAVGGWPCEPHLPNNSIALSKNNAHLLRPRPELCPRPSLGHLTPIVQIVRELLRTDFKEALIFDLQRRASTKEGNAPSREASARTAHFECSGFNNVAPYNLLNCAPPLRTRSATPGTSLPTPALPETSSSRDSLWDGGTSAGGVGRRHASENECCETGRVARRNSASGLGKSPRLRDARKMSHHKKKHRSVNCGAFRKLK
jgi:hypothetical protein